MSAEAVDGPGTLHGCSAVVLRQRAGAKGACTYPVTGRIQRAAIDHCYSTKEEWFWLWQHCHLAVTVQKSEKHGSSSSKTKTKS